MPDQPSGFTVTDRRKFTMKATCAKAPPRLRKRRTPSRSRTPAPIRSSAPSWSRMLLRAEKEVEKEVVNRDLEPLPTEEEDAEEPPVPTAAETAQQDADYRASSKKLDEMISQANPGAREAVGRSSDMTFDKLVQSIYMTAALQMGAGYPARRAASRRYPRRAPEYRHAQRPDGEDKGQSHDKEQRLLQNALFELRMMFMEITNAISSTPIIPPPSHQCGKEVSLPS